MSTETSIPDAAPPAPQSSSYLAVERTPEGSRNDRLNRAAFSLGTLVGAGALRRAEAEGALLSAAAVAGLPPAEAARTVASGLDAGAERPRYLSHDVVPMVRGRERVEGEPARSSVPSRSRAMARRREEQRRP